MLQQSWNIGVEAVVIQPSFVDQRLCIHLAAYIGRHLNTLIQRCQPPGHQPAHGHPDRADPLRINIRP
ncbi:hypothetical protein D3C73_1031860 [compost metagenome]